MAATPLLWLSPSEVPPLPAGWQALPTEQVVDSLKPGPLYENKTVKPTGLVPVVSQAETEFLGYHNDAPGVNATPQTPVVTFTNHTCALRLMKQPFSCIQNVFPKVGKPDICDTTFFYFAAKNRVVLAEYKGHHPLFRQAHIPIPPLPIQRRIASILSAYDDLIENHRKRIAILEEMARRLYREWFVHFRYPGHESVPLVDSSLGMIPQGWAVRSLGSITTKIGSGSTPRGGKESYQKAGTPLIRSMNVYDNEFLEDALAYIDKSQAQDLSNVTVQKGDVLLNITGASVARCTLAPGYFLPARVNQHVSILRFAPGETDPHFLVRTLTSDETKRRLLGLAQVGATREALTKEGLEAFMIVSPSLLIIKDFGRIAESQWTLVENLRQQISTLRQTRDLLLPRLMSGTLSVTAAEVAVP